MTPFYQGENLVSSHYNRALCRY